MSAPAGRRVGGWLRRCWPGLALAIAVAAVYGGIVRLPYVQDDWTLIYRSRLRSTSELLPYLFHIKGSLWYRPVTPLYMRAMLATFGHNALPHHLIVLTIHFLNALMVTGIARRLRARRPEAWAAGFLYAGALALHLDTFVWGVGISVTSGSFFYLLTLLLYFSGRRGTSILTAALAMFCRDDTFTVVPVLFAAALFAVGPQAAERSLRQRLWALWPHGLLLAGYLCFRLQGLALTELPAQHPYHVGADALHPRLLLTYLGWLLQGIFGLYQIQVRLHEAAVTRGLLVVLGVVLAAGLWADRGHGDRARPRLLLFLLAWLVAGLGPGLLLANHPYRYYATYSAPAAVLLCICLLTGLLAHLRAPRRAVVTLLALLVMVQGVAAAGFMRAELAKGVYQHYIPGSNNLLRKAAWVTLVREALTREFPAPPADSVLVLDGVELNAFGTERGVRAWYDREDLAVLPLATVTNDASGFYGIDRHWRLRRQVATRVPLTPEKTFGFRFDGHTLVPFDVARSVLPVE